MIRLVLLSVLAGCHAGGGPIVAYSPQSGLRLGGEVSGGVALARASVGYTRGMLGEPRSRQYLTFDPGYVGTVHTGMTRGDSMAGGGVTVGKAWGEDESVPVVGAWATGGVTFDSCMDNGGVHPVYSVAIGYRVLGGVGELFITPKVSALAIPASCD